MYNPHRLHSALGYRSRHEFEKLSIRTMIEAPEGLVIFDTGDDVEDGERALAAFRTVSDKPVRAIIYSHNHYAHGTMPFL